MSVDISPEQRESGYLKEVRALQEKLKDANNRNAILVSDNDGMRAKLKAVEAEYKKWDEGEEVVSEDSSCLTYPCSYDTMIRIGDILGDLLVTGSASNSDEYDNLARAQQRVAKASSSLDETCVAFLDRHGYTKLVMAIRSLRKLEKA